MSDITIQNLRKTYDDVRAVKGIDLEIDDGEFLVVVGPSGCGKSTTLRMLAGLESVTDGSIAIGDRVVNEVPPKDRSIAMVFQNYALYPHMTAAENMKFGMKSASEFSGDEIERRVEEATETLDIAHLRDRKPKELSGGERQRVAIGRALVREPDVFLMDEPLSNLDAKLRVQMRAELLKLHRDLETTTVYVTHDQTEAMTLGDRVAVLEDGRLQQVAAPQELYDYPSNQFVAGFVGEPAMNFIPASVRQRGDEHVATAPGLSLTLPAGSGLDGIDDDGLTLGVRPEDVSLVSNRAAASESFTAEVTVTEPLGELLLLHCRLGDEEIRVKVEPRSRIAAGDIVELAVDTDRLHLFDSDGDAVYHSSVPEQVTESALAD
ncbi:glycerol-3-phosphate ABC transporter ATP-binding protein [Haloferax gibbonsii ATCC 33959]|uniref:ABC-type D-xylose/L-arabinose transporter n=1 Tax=Haloferax gibbonsii (strain ATCC 33959 / DSM 4427 / JCM 8863 / NBRC 102184 / NCIMB 2188 / Ma 2.38) TaxID=1227459 RepID=M0HLQ5_HALGM|nr:sn-glycerol-3-phosphate ABC transporter ATP-binding protein UgpC [Haloferax gibbonsii]ELZ85426.1 glycerol-3-phosphate ABC transporter ATP-binding protein [Haloferax gibbonsii ATCC 33959]